MMTKKIGFLMAAMAVAGAGVAAAQTSADEARVRVSVNAGLQTGSESLTSSSKFTAYDEEGTVDSNIETSGGALLDGSIAVRVWRQLSVGVTLQRTSGSGDAAVTGRAPHPIYYGRPRSFSATVSDLERSQQALLFSLAWTVPVGSRAEVTLSGGPSQVRVSQDVVADVSLSETGAPFTSVSAAVKSSSTKGTAMGVHVGADGSYFMTKQLGIGAFVRYLTGSAEISVGSGRVDTAAGGLQVGGGLRFRF